MAMLAGLAVALLLAGCGREPPRRPLAAQPAAGQRAPTLPAAQFPADPTRVSSIAAPQDAGQPAARDQKIAEIYPATGARVNRGGATPPPQRRAGDISLNFTDTDIREVAAAILRDLLGVNYVIDPAVRGTVTLQTGTPLERADLIPVLEAALAANGAVLTQQGGLYRVTPDAAAAAGAIRLGAAAESGGLQIAVLPLQFIGAAEMKTILDPLLPEEGMVRADPHRGLIIVTGTSREIQLARDTIGVFDVDQLAGNSVLLESLEHADAAAVAVELDNLFGDLTKGPLAGTVRIIPVERMNALIVIAKQPRYIDEARNWIARLDRTRRANERRLFVYYAQNGKASDLARSLRGILQAEGDGSLAETEPAPALSEAAPGGVPTLAARTYQPQATAGAEQPPQQTPIPVTAPSPAPGTGVRVMADDASNAVLVLATTQEYALVEEVLLKLDLEPLQVLIEATILEVQLRDQLRFGVQFFLDSGGLGITDDGTTILSSGTNSLISPTFPGFAFTLNSGSQPRAVIDALSQVTDVKVISSPRVLVVDNQAAQLQVGDEVPIITQQSTANLVGDTRTVNSIEYRQTGVTLSVTPRVNASGLVTLEIAQEVSDVRQTDTSTINSPTFQQRRIISTVAIRSGQTLALGGLIREDSTDDRSGLPVLSDLPVVGPLFGRTSANLNRRELLVMITPTVVRNQEEARDATAELRRQFEAVLELEATGMRRPRSFRGELPRLFD